MFFVKDGKQMSARNASYQQMRGVDFVEETKDYERVIDGLKDLIKNPRQHKPLGAASTSNISYHSHNKT